MFEWCYITNGCLASNFCLLNVWYELVKANFTRQHTIERIDRIVILNNLREY
jgi:hypothetical protein